MDADTEGVSVSAGIYLLRPICHVGTNNTITYFIPNRWMHS